MKENTMLDLELVAKRIANLKATPASGIAKMIKNLPPIDVTALDKELDTCYPDAEKMDPNDLTVNIHTQRNIDVDNLKKICLVSFEWKKFGAIVVVKRVDEHGLVWYSTVDGQHRIADAQVNGVKRIPVIIYDNTAGDPTVEPTLFGSLNSGQPIDLITVHRILLQLQDPDRLALQKIVNDNGYYFHMKGQYGVRNTGISKIQYLLEIIKSYPTNDKWVDLLERAFSIYRNSFPDVGAVEADLIKHIALFLDKAEVFHTNNVGGVWDDSNLVQFLRGHEYNNSRLGVAFRKKVIDECKMKYDPKSSDFREYWFINWLADNMLDPSVEDPAITLKLRKLAASPLKLSHELFVLNKLISDNPQKMEQLAKMFAEEMEE